MSKTTEILPLAGFGGDLGHDAVHIFPLGLHIGNQCDLGAGTNQVVLGVGGLEVQVAVNVILQETQTHLQRHNQCTHGEHFHFFVGQSGGGFQETPGVDLKQVQVHAHLGQVSLILGGGSGAGVTIQPIAFLTVYQGNVRLIPVDGNKSALDGIINAIPDVVTKVKEFVGDRKKNKEGEIAKTDDFSEITVDDIDI